MALADRPKGFLPYDVNAPIRYFPIKASVTLARGDAVILTSGQVDIALAASANLLGVVARACASLAAATLVPVWSDPDTEFIGRQDDATALAVGSEYDLVGATGAMQIDGDASSTDVFKLVREYDAAEADAIGKGWIFKINKHLLAQID
jgi:hypothetical protein